MNRVFRYTTWLMITVIMAVSCHTLPSFAADAEEEEAIGKETYSDIIKEYGRYDDKNLQEYVQRVGKKVLTKVRDPGFEYHFTVVDDEMVNAFALPGGYIYVTRGLLAALNSEAALAGVLGHEIGHVIGHHAMKQMKKQIGSLLLTLAGIAASEDVRNNAAAWLTITQTLSQQILLGYGREMEMESDQVGLITAEEAGYSPDGIVNFLQSLRTMERMGGHSYHGFQATHPDTITRIVEAEGKAELLKARGNKIEMYRDRYLDAIDGLRYGKPELKKKTWPPYVIRIHTVKAGETFRSIAKDCGVEESMAMTMATLNSMDVNDKLTPGYRIKSIIPAKNTNKVLQLEEMKDNEIGPGPGDGAGEPPAGGDKKSDGGTKGGDRRSP